MPTSPDDLAPAGHDPANPRTWNLNGAAFNGGPQELTTVLMEAIRRAGAATVEYGYRPHPITGEDPLPGQPVVWYCDVLLSDGRRFQTQRHSRADLDHSSIACGLETLAEMVRLLGGNVVLSIG